MNNYKISNKKLLKEVIRKSEKQLIELINHLPQTIFECDLDGKITFVNESGLKAFGYSKKYLKENLSLFDIVVPEEAEQAKSNFMKLFTGEKFETFEYTVQRKDKKKFNVIVYPSIIFKDDMPVGIRGISVDVSEQKRIKEELIKAKEAAEKANKAKSTFLANMSHELRTPMNSIFGMIEMLNKTKPDKKQEQYISVIKKSTETLLHIINDILDISKIEAGEVVLEEIDFKLDEIIGTLINLNSYSAANKGIKLRYSMSDEIKGLVILSDPIRLYQILSNLISNALKFTNNGYVEVKVKTIKETPGSITLRFSIEDSGIGIKKDKINVIFNSFTQGDVSITRKYGGTGLGLTIAKQFVELLGGKMEVKSKPDKGSTFFFTLTFRKGDKSNLVGEAEKDAENEKNYNLKGINILLVEDQEFNRMIIENIVKGWGGRIKSVDDGQKALDEIQSKENKYDVVLMDVQIPVLSGLEVTQYVRKNLPYPIKNIPIIALTANAFKENLNECIKSGMNDFISKPFKSKELYRKITQNLQIQDYSKTIVKENLKKLVFPVDKDKKLYNLKELRKIGNEKFVKNTVKLFINTATKGIALLKEHIKNNDLQNIATTAHKIRPSIVIMGMKNTGKMLQEIEKLAKRKTGHENLNNLFEKVEHDLIKTFKSLKKESI